MWYAIGDHHHGNICGVVEEVSSQRMFFSFKPCVKRFAPWSSSNTLNVSFSVSSLMAPERSGRNTVIMTEITSAQPETIKGLRMFGVKLPLVKLCLLLMLMYYKQQYLIKISKINHLKLHKIWIKHICRIIYNGVPFIQWKYFIGIEQTRWEAKSGL